MNEMLDLLNQQLNNPDCSILSGLLLGNAIAFKNIFFLLFMWFILKILDNFIMKPFIRWIKTKTKRGNKNGRTGKSK